MSPKNKKELILIRKKLDSLDNKLIELIKKRTKLVDKVVQLKVFKKEILDKKRISELTNREVQFIGNLKLAKINKNKVEELDRAIFSDKILDL